jgi:hypothetical protein
MGLKLNMNDSDNSRTYFSLKPGGYSHLRELEFYGMSILNVRKTIIVAECTLVH